MSILYIGWDKHYGFQLYQSDPSGNYGGWKATCIGNNSAVCILSFCKESRDLKNLGIKFSKVVMVT